MNAMLRLTSVTALTGLSKSTIYLRTSQGLWPKPVNLGGNKGSAVAWPDYEVAKMNAARIAGMTDDEVVELVSKLEDARKQALAVAA